MKHRFLILADDFTGANDTGVQLSARGNAVRVILDSSAIDPTASCSYVLDTESRDMDPNAAYAATLQQSIAIDFSAFSCVMKKVDSTLRGNIAAEVKALDARFHPDRILFLPALPDLGRTTVGQIHRLHGTPITQTEMARDPKNPVVCDNLPALLASVFSEDIRHYALTEIRSHLVLDDTRIATFDAETNEDLQHVLHAATQTGDRILWIGTAALAEQLMNTLARPMPALAICASVNSVTRTQILEAERAGIPLVKVSIPELLAEQVQPSAYADACIQLLQKERDVILLSSATYADTELARSRKAGAQKHMTLPDISRYTQTVLETISRQILAEVPLSGVFLTGGDTAIHFLQSIDARGSDILGEVAIGIPLIRVFGGPYDGMKLITKSGAFGNPDAIVFALKKLKETADCI